MFTFKVQGRIGSINEYKNNVVKISVAAERVVQGRSDNYTATEWAPCVSFDPELNKKLMASLVVGQNVTLEGLVVPRPRDKNAEKMIQACCDCMTGMMMPGCMMMMCMNGMPMCCMAM